MSRGSVGSQVAPQESSARRFVESSAFRGKFGDPASQLQIPGGGRGKVQALWVCLRKWEFRPLAAEELFLRVPSRVSADFRKTKSNF